MIQQEPIAPVWNWEIPRDIFQKDSKRLKDWLDWYIYFSLIFDDNGMFVLQVLTWQSSQFTQIQEASSKRIRLQSWSSVCLLKLYLNGSVSKKNASCIACVGYLHKIHRIIFTKLAVITRHNSISLSPLLLKLVHLFSSWYTLHLLKTKWQS